MATFEYESVRRDGQASAGVIDASDRAEAVRLLTRRGEVPTRVLPSGQGVRKKVGAREGASSSQTKSASSGRVGKGSMRMSELAVFIREVATALEAGLPLMQALKAVAKQAYTPRQRAILSHLMDRIESGRSFAQAASEWGPPFSDMIIGMIRAGEASGKLEVVMLQLADLLDRDTETRREVASALIYPAILIIVLVAGVSVIVTVIIPRILSVFEGEIARLPMPTRIVHGTAEFAGTWWIAILVGIVAAIFAFRYLYKTPGFRLEYDRLLLRIPVVGALLRDVAVGRFTRTLGTLMGSGIPIIDALLITRNTLGNRAMEQVIDDVAEKVREGKSIAEPMEESGYFPPLLIQIIDLGERSGRLDSMLTQAANSLDRRTGASIKMFTAVLPPVIVVVMALVVGFILAAVLLPLIEMQSMIG